MACRAEDVLNVMKSWEGYSVQNGKHKQIIDLYNSKLPLPSGYKVRYTDAWCDTTVSAAGIKANGDDIIGRECGCERHVKIFINKGIWIEDGTVTPKPGWIIVYNWDSGVQPNNGFSDHIGYVAYIKNGVITCIEGNMSDKVGYRSIPVGYGYIRGFAEPKYLGSGIVAPSTKPSQSSGTLSKNISSYVFAKSNGVNVRTWAGAEYPNILSYPRLNKGERIAVCDTLKDKGGNMWYYAFIDNRVYGFVCAADFTASQQADFAFTKGDKVKVRNAVTYNGAPFKCWYDKYDVISVSGDRIVIGIGKVVTAAVHKSNLEKI